MKPDYIPPIVTIYPQLISLGFGKKTQHLSNSK
jgi:hypothetical protein